MKNTEEIKNMRAMDEVALIKEILAKKKDLAILSLQIKAGKANKTSNVSKQRKNIARLTTILNEKKYTEVTNG